MVSIVSTIVLGANFSFTDSRPAVPSLSLRFLFSINSAQALISCSIFFSSGWSLPVVARPRRDRLEHGGSISLPVFSFTTSFAPSISKDIAGFPHSIACGSVRARPSLSEQCTSISDDCIASGIWLGGHPAEYSGKVWIRILKQEKNLNQPHVSTIRWGPWHYQGKLPPDANMSVSLMHAKSNDGLSVPIFFKIVPPCHVIFGQDEPLGKKVIDINYGWKKVRQ